MESEEINKKDAATIGEMVADDYRKAEVFKKFGLDFCCGGRKSLDSACNETCIAVAELKDALEALDKEQEEFSKDFNRMELNDLIDHIINTHHKYVNQALPLLDEFSAKVAQVHGDANPEVVEIANHYRPLPAIANQEGGENPG